MRWRVGLIDITAAIVVAVVIALPPRQPKVASAYFDQINLKAPPEAALRTMSLLQSALAKTPGDVDAADQLSEILAHFGQTDDALRIAGSAADAAGPDRWRALLSVAAVHADRVEFETARAFSDRALEACQASDTTKCPGDAVARIQIFADELDRAIAAVKAGKNPRTDPEGFREAVGERRLPPVRVN